jgi:dephospho-CoA kinase
VKVVVARCFVSFGVALQVIIDRKGFTASTSTSICYTRYMTNRPNVKIIAPVGLAGSGKSSVVEHLTKKGYPKVYAGGVIYKAMEEAGIEVTWDSQKTFREEIRKREGKDFVMRRIIKEIHDIVDAGQHRIVLDGLYTWSEYKLLKQEFPGQVTVVAVVTPKHLRKNRMAIRPERPMTSEEVDERDWAEIENLEKGGPIAIADFFIHNAGSIEKLHDEVDEIIETLNLNK